MGSRSIVPPLPPGSCRGSDGPLSLTGVTFSVICMGIPWRLALPYRPDDRSRGPMEVVELPTARKKPTIPRGKGYIECMRCTPIFKSVAKSLLKLA